MERRRIERPLIIRFVEASIPRGLASVVKNHEVK